MKEILCLLWLSSMVVAAVGDNLREIFKECKTSLPDFDQCILRGLNDARQFFSTGIPEYGIEPIDPLHAPSVNETWSNSVGTLTAKLPDAIETDWSQAKFTEFKSDPGQGWLRFTLTFPDKTVTSSSELAGSLAGFPFHRNGKFYFRFFDYVKTITVRWPKVKGTGGYGPFQVEAVTRGVRDVTSHYTNLGTKNLVSDTLLNYLMMHYPLQLYNLVTPLVDDLGSQAYTEIYNRNFGQFPFDTFFA